ncbi:Nucleolar protein 9 [Tulasnella sp. 330]|nr:Nucleolar protein 9 [Tulasnella sp. 330]KAG8882017.1 Nucleolar protein 9 [Tulasnella sp. 331]KAG8887982.1 Nucleolar protein 9 [Tulasnella sp. 332]
MPKEPRKRARKHKPETAPVDEDEGAGPSWIAQSEPHLAAHPLDQELKAYFRSVDIKLQEWASEDAEHVQLIEDQREDRTAFFLAATSEIKGHEVELTEDPECSKIIEKMIRLMDDALLRTLLVGLVDVLPTLVKHRFGSHVCQTLLISSAETINREMQGIVADSPEENQSSVLPTMRALILQVSEILLEDSLPLMSDASASPVIRTLLALLSIQTWTEVLPLKEPRHNPGKTRRSMNGQHQTAIVVGKPTAEANHNVAIPPGFGIMARRYLEHVCTGATAEAMRDAVYDEITGPALQVLIRLEAQSDLSSQAGSLFDFIFPGVVSGDKDVTKEHSDHLHQIFRHPVGSHFVEVVVASASEPVFRQLWNRLIRKNLSSLVNDPVANFVVASAFGKVNAKGLEDVMPLPSTAWSECFESGRTGVIQALIKRSAELRSHEAEVVGIVSTAIGVQTTDDERLIVPCVMTLQTVKAYREPPSAAPNMYGPRHGGGSRPRTKEPSVQGALILQSLLHLNAPHNGMVLRSVEALLPEESLSMAKSPVSSRVFDVLLESSTVPYRSKRALVTAFIGQFHLLVDDRVGSFVAEKLWQAGDPYLRERIAKSLYEHEEALLASRSGKYFIRNANLWLLKKDPIKWRKQQAEKANQNKKEAVPSPHMQTQPTSAVDLSPSASNGSEKKREKNKKKRKRGEEVSDEIDGIFSAAKKKGRRP